MPPLAVGLGGVGAALLWFYVSWPLAVIPPVVALLLGFGADYIARREINNDDPVAATKWIYGWALAPFAWAIAAAAAVIIVAVELDPGKEPPVERKEIFSAAAAALGAFFVAMFVKDAEEADEKWVGARFKKRFQARFANRFPRPPGPDQAATRGELAVNEEAVFGFSGWNAAARKERAKIVKEELAKR
jgi:hypothetical protein